MHGLRTQDSQDSEAELSCVPFLGQSRADEFLPPRNVLELLHSSCPMAWISNFQTHEHYLMSLKHFLSLHIIYQFAKWSGLGITEQHCTFAFDRFSNSQ